MLGVAFGSRSHGSNSLRLWENANFPFGQRPLRLLRVVLEFGTVTTRTRVNGRASLKVDDPHYNFRQIPPELVPVARNYEYLREVFLNRSRSVPEWGQPFIEPRDHWVEIVVPSVEVPEDRARRELRFKCPPDFPKLPFLELGNDVIEWYRELTNDDIEDETVNGLVDFHPSQILELIPSAFFKKSCQSDHRRTASHSPCPADGVDEAQSSISGKNQKHLVALQQAVMEINRSRLEGFRDEFGDTWYKKYHCKNGLMKRWFQSRRCASGEIESIACFRINWSLADEHLVELFKLWLNENRQMRSRNIYEGESFIKICGSDLERLATLRLKQILGTYSKVKEYVDAQNTIVRYPSTVGIRAVEKRVREARGILRIKFDCEV